MTANPGMLNIPLAISSQLIAYNVPGLNGGLKLDGPALAGIYAGTIRSWDAAAIATMNPGVKLPHAAIVPIPPPRQFGRFVYLQSISDVLNRLVGVRTELRHRRCVARRARCESGNG